MTWWEEDLPEEHRRKVRALMKHLKRRYRYQYPDAYDAAMGILYGDTRMKIGVIERLATDAVPIPAELSSTVLEAVHGWQAHQGNQWKVSATGNFWSLIVHHVAVRHASGLTLNAAMRQVQRNIKERHMLIVPIGFKTPSLATIKRRYIELGGTQLAEHFRNED
jgi:hypothetical protein